MATEKIPVTVRWLSTASDDEFEHAVQHLDVRELLQLISHLQQEMTNEQQRFDELGDRLRDRRERVHRSGGGGVEDSESDRETKTLSSSLFRSQIRLAQLCTRNMRCFTQQEVIRAKLDQRQIDGEGHGATAAEPSSSSWHGSSPSPTPSSPCHDGDSSASDSEVDESDRRLSRRVPSVQDILQSVRALRLSATVSSNNNLASQDNGPVTVPSPDYEQDDVDNNVVCSPRRTLDDGHRNANVQRYGNSIYDDDSKTSSEPTPSPSTIQQRPVLSCSELVAKFQNENRDLKKIPTEEDRYRVENGGEDRDKDVEEDADDDDDSGVGTEEGTLSKRMLGGGGNGFGQRRRRERKSLFDHMTPPTTTTADASESTNGHPTNEEPPKPPSSKMTGIDEDVIPSIIEQFGSTIDGHSSDGPSKKTNASWNTERLLSHLYKIPEPILPSSPPPNYVNMEGHLEMLPSGRRQATYWNAWKRRYFRLKDGFLYCHSNAKSDEASLCLQLMGGRVDVVESSLLGVDDGKGHYLVLRCGKGSDTERWRRALLTHTAENYEQTYVQPVRAYPQFYEDVILIDIGSCSVRAGILCNQPTLPQVYFPTVCAKDRTTGEIVYGIEALRPSVRKNSTLKFPLKPSAKITKFTVNMEAVAGILGRVFVDLNVDPSDYQVQLSLPRSFPFRSQADVLDLLMTEFGVRAVNLTAQTVLALLSYRTNSGVVVDVGERTEVIPIIDGYVVESGVSRTPYGGSRLCDHLRHFLMQRHCGLVSETESFLLRYVLENACYCAERYRSELQAFHTDPKSFETVVSLGQFFDGDAPWQSIALDGGRFQVPEGLFNPDAWGLDNRGIHKLVSKAIQECGLDARKEMSRSIYLSGGVTMLPGFTERLQVEMDRLTPPAVVPKVHASSYRAHAAYLGSCVWASGSGFHQAKITRNDWVANGSACLKKWHF